MLPEKILKLKEKIIYEATIVEKMITKCIEGLLNKETEKINEVMNKDEPTINEIEVEIDELCVETIALFNPTAGDLRTVLMILKMNNDLERMGDLCVNIAQSAHYLIERPEVKPLIDLPRMGRETAKMLKDSITSFTEKDNVIAKDVCERDDVVDNLANQILRELITYMISDPKTIERSLHLLRVAKNLERIADLSTNISEDVIYMTEGKVIRHGKSDI
ncbi:MAG: phosphate signaling complex protein PhoU [Spirochaetota bacterium]